MWVRGLKLLLFASCRGAVGVAPYVGAWIETKGYSIGRFGCEVAPYVGAWIETSFALPSPLRHWSHPMWVRGLKHKLTEWDVLYASVAPYVGAWIETSACVTRGQ